MDTRNVGGSKYADLTGFKRDLLFALARIGPSKGLRVRDEVQDYRGEEISTGRIYPCLDELVDDGLISKSPRDKRTNEYALTEEGIEALRERTEWQEHCLEQVAWRTDPGTADSTG